MTGASPEGEPVARANDGPRVRKVVHIAGQVHGVFFRDHTCELARSIDVTGWVRNLSDGRVEAAFEGTPGAVDRMVKWCHHGPPRARVRGVLVHDQEPLGDVGFHIR